MPPRHETFTNGRMPQNEPGGDLGTPRALLPAGSKEWCYRTLQRLAWALDKRMIHDNEYDKVLAELVEHRAWEQLPTPEEHYANLDDMLLREIGITSKSGRELTQQRAENPMPLLDNRGPATKEEKESIPDVIRNSRGTVDDYGTSADYLTARIARDHPDIHERMKAGEFRSVRQAALAAGIVPPMVQIPLDPRKAARLLRKHFTEDDIAELIRLISVPTVPLPLDPDEATDVLLESMPPETLAALSRSLAIAVAARMYSESTTRSNSDEEHDEETIEPEHPPVIKSSHATKSTRQSPKSIQPQEIEQILAWKAEGKPQTWIAKQVGRDASTVSKAIKRAETRVNDGANGQPHRHHPDGEYSQEQEPQDQS